MRDAEEFDAFYAACAGRVVGHVFALTGNRGEAEDAVAEAFMRAWQRWRTVREADSPEAWVRRVASRIAVSSWRKTINRMRAHHRAAVDQSVPGLSEDHVALLQALQRLSANQRRAVVLHHLNDLSVAEVAAEMQAPIGTVKAYLARGRRAMAGMLTEAHQEGASHG
ncbi:RNA polymerase sigma-70 factor (ECF subfamily) [Micromonospora kangleipakensis]|uniref:RNA polymerase sigma-70 factor (ECF subfamily) n=1 Tax=Micromonospora kangleipakensis TaxID=1077942 RepID=A0A4Q8B4L2_9ACTN|nr:SigE family RNA polymerase sigma factor [Micromonospora kangleipakensis]RZU72248.1 RNA polymerase sigma-70 factor (ECF subfamily) [Micromonospora kangleipakensis]